MANSKLIEVELIGWGVHLNAVTNGTISMNNVSWNNRANLGDSAGILVVNGSHRNNFKNNWCRHCGDGFFIGNEHGCPSNNNIVTANDCSFASANAFEVRCGRSAIPLAMD